MGARLAWRQVVRRALLALGLLCATPVAILALAPYVPQVRQLIRAKVVAAVSDALHARVELDRLERLSWFGARIAGLRVRAEDGQPLARVDAIDLRWNLLGLARKRIEIAGVVIERPWVDLGEPGGKGGGLPGLFAGEPSTPSEPAQPLAFRVEVGRVDVLDGTLDVAAGGARYQLAPLAIECSATIADAVAFHISRLSAAIARERSVIGSVRVVDVALGEQGPLRGRIELLVGQSKTLLVAQRAAERAPLRGTLELTGLSAETLATFGVEEPRLLAPIGASLEFETEPGALQYAGVVQTGGGELHVHGHSGAGEHRASLAAERFVLGQVIEASLAPISGRLELRLRSDPASSDLLLEANLAQARYAAADLPELAAHVRRTQAGMVSVESLTLRAHGDMLASAKARIEQDGSVQGRLSVHVKELADTGLGAAAGIVLAGGLEGDVSFARTQKGAIQTKGRLRFSRARADSVRAQELNAEFELGGEHIEHPRIVLVVHTTELALGDATPLPSLELRVSGGPERYRLVGSAPGRGELRGELLWGDRELRASGSAQFELGTASQPRVVHAELGALRYQPGGELAVHALRLRYGAAFADMEGRLSSRASGRLRARLVIPSIAALAFTPPSLEGALTLDAEARGSLLAPNVRADARLIAPELQGIKRIVVDVHGEARTRARRAALRVSAKSDAGRVEVELTNQLAAARLDAQSLLTGRSAGTLRIDRFALSHLSAWPKGPGMPSVAELSGELAAQRSLGAFRLNGDLSSSLGFGAGRGDVQLRARANLEHERGRLQVDADDAQGALLRATLESDLHGLHLARLADELSTAWKDRSFHASAKLSERRLEALPMLQAFELPELAAAVRASAELELTRVRDREPEARFAVHAAYAVERAHPRAKTAADSAAHCAADARPELDAELRLSRGALRAQLRAGASGKPVVWASAETQLPLARLEDPRRLREQPLSLRLDASALRLAEWPLACDAGEGELSGHAELTRSAAGELHARADLRAAELRVGSVPALSGSLRANLDRDVLRMASDLQVAGGSGRATLELPIAAEQPLPRVATDRPMHGRVQLHSLDARALLGALQDVRASTGTIGADVTLGGTPSQPETNGTIALRDVTLTLPELGQRIERIQGDVRLVRRTLSIDGITLRDREGKARVRGTVTLRDRFAVHAELAADVSNFPLRKAGVILGRFQGQARLVADIAPERSRFELAVRRARLELSDDSAAGVQSLRANPDIAFVDDAARTSDAGETGTSRPLTFVIDASEPFWVTRSDFSVLVATKMQVELGTGPPNVSGRLTLKRGFVELIGRSFNIEEGSLEFTGGRTVEPMLDLTATRRTRDGQTIKIHASGSLREPRLEFFLDDSAVTAGKALAADSGSHNTQSDGTIKQQVSSMASGLAAGVLTLGARREFGELMPVLSIDAGEGGPSLRAGIEADRLIPDFLRHVVVDAYVEGILSTGTSSGGSGAVAGGLAVPAALLELRFLHSLVGEAQYGPGERWSIDLGWEPSTKP